MTTNENQSPADAGQPAVDFEQLLAASGEDPIFLKDLAKLYFDQAREIMPALSAALQEESASDVDYLAHKLAGANHQLADRLG